MLRIVQRPTPWRLHYSRVRLTGQVGTLKAQTETDRDRQRQTEPQQMEFLSDISGGSDQLRPSFFELAAQEQLRDLLPPVFKYILSVFAQRNPRYLLRIFNKSDELFAIAIWFIERHYLKTWGGSFAENFYGLKRRRVLGSGVGERSKEAVRLTGESEKLGKSEIRLSLVFLVSRYGSLSSQG